VNNRLLALLVVFAPLSLSSFGGGQAIIASVAHQSVQLHGWMNQQQFTDMFALARAAPGPSTLIAALIGWQVGGLQGAMVATVAIFVPSSIFFVAVTRLWFRFHRTRWRAVVADGLMPVTIGLVFAGGLAVMQSAHMNVVEMITAAATMGLLYLTRLGPFLLVGVVTAIYGCLYVLDPRLFT
jgi:chromate transporter